eukprot:scaffold438_cov250-Pinguiococcus_pyrenoidosus.AAC.1
MSALAKSPESFLFQLTVGRAPREAVGDDEDDEFDGSRRFHSPGISMLLKRRFSSGCNALLPGAIFPPPRCFLLGSSRGLRLPSFRSQSTRSAAMTPRSPSPAVDCLKGAEYWEEGGIPTAAAKCS